MDRNNIDEVAKAITSLKVWKKASKYNWALVSELFDKPLIAAINPAAAGPIAGGCCCSTDSSRIGIFLSSARTPIFRSRLPCLTSTITR